MKRTAFRRPDPPPSRARVKQWEGPTPTRRKPAVAMLVAPRRVVAVPKENALQHKGYMAEVRKIACRRCWTLAAPRQFAHCDLGKGAGIKTDCRLGWAGCAPCHYFVGSTGRMSKQGRREFERFAAASTRAEIIARGAWPKRLPRWEEA